MPRARPAHPADEAVTAHVFVADLDHPRLGADDDRHLRRALRLRDGQPLTISDAAGSWRRARLGPELEPDGPVMVVPPPSPPLTVALPAVKGDRTEWAVQKTTEVGIDHIVVIETERSVVRWNDERADRHLDRLRRVAREAAMQARLVRVPTIQGVTAVADLFEHLPVGSVAMAQRDGHRLTVATPTVVVGPEGGWSPHELALAACHVDLSANVLRVETAALVAAVSLTQLRSAQMDDRGEC